MNAKCRTADLSPRLRVVFYGDISSAFLAERILLCLAQTLSLFAQRWEETFVGIVPLKDRWLVELNKADALEPKL